ncbi:DUF4040 domain-containing protein [Aerosakkonemataceae cyanobacterium BLCC-F154]|uniref:DUF4040 domain-containing protein n=1 Tax=Floridaenema fluviatile BLCC-F154 TaxID=3153640 RepID=A0ABV4YK47_9CYAN
MNNPDLYIYLLVALLPLSACMTVFEVNPYHALVIRGILGAIAAMVYAVLGAADVALTEALVGTMLAITLYAVAVRSSMVMRLGVVKDVAKESEEDLNFKRLMEALRRTFSKRFMRLEIISYEDKDGLQQALMEKEIHATCVRFVPLEMDDREEEEKPYHTATRVKSIYEIMESELSSSETSLTYVNIPDSGEKH